MFISEGLHWHVFSGERLACAGVVSAGVSAEARFRPASNIVNVLSKRCFYFTIRVNPLGLQLPLVCMGALKPRPPVPVRSRESPPLNSC